MVIALVLYLLTHFFWVQKPSMMAIQQIACSKVLLSRETMLVIQLGISYNLLGSNSASVDHTLSQREGFRLRTQLTPPDIFGVCASIKDMCILPLPLPSDQVFQSDSVRPALLVTWVTSPLTYSEGQGHTHLMIYLFACLVHVPYSTGKMIHWHLFTADTQHHDSNYATRFWFLFVVNLWWLIFTCLLLLA